MIGTTQILVFLLQALVAIGVPIAIAIVWCVKKKEKFTTFLIGAAVFIVFVLIIESNLNGLLLLPMLKSVKSAVLYKILYVLTGTLMAGLFEESGRFISFKFFLNKRKEKETAITYGLGHGGIEVIILVGIAGISNIANALLINSPMWEITLEQTAQIAPDQLAALEALPEALASASFGTLVLSFIERAGAMLAHLGCSMVVFKAANVKGKVWLYPVAVGIHALFDVPAALYQIGVITNLIVLEVLLLVIGCVIFFGAYKLIYKKL